MGEGMRGGPGDAVKRDGITKAEFLARPLALFDKADANHDGKVTAEEMKAARQAFPDGWKDRREIGRTRRRDRVGQDVEIAVGAGSVKEQETIKKHEQGARDRKTAET